MKTNKISLLFAIIAVLFSLKGLAQNTSFPFEVKISGTGNQSIIFIPGFGCSSEVWNETVSNYEKKYTCYSLTMAGFAGAAPKENASIENWTKGIAEYIRLNKINIPIIIGHSMGGGLGMALASKYPDLVSKLIIVDALPCLAALSNPEFKSKENNDCSAIVTQMMSVTNEQFYQMQKATIGSMVANDSKQDSVVDWTVKSDRKTFASMYCDFLNTDLRTDIGAITCPTLILLEPSFSMYKTAVEDQYKNLKTAEFKYATKGLHFIMYDDTEWYNNQLNTFINK